MWDCKQCWWMYVCYQQSCMKPIYTYPLEFDDSKGEMCLNLWYSLAPKLGKCLKIIDNWRGIAGFSTDSFIMLSREFWCVSLVSFTVFCQNWKVRKKDGSSAMINHEFAILLEDWHIWCSRLNYSDCDYNKRWWHGTIVLIIIVCWLSAIILFCEVYGITWVILFLYSTRN